MLYPSSVANISLPCNGFDTQDVGFFICDGVDAYHPRNPEDNPLYGVVSEHLETFLARQRERERPVPHFVERELRAFLDCGVLARGFVRALLTAILSGSAAAAGIAWSNSIGNLAGYVAPHPIGLIRDHTHSMSPALLALCCAQLLTAFMVLVVTRHKR
jgi:hypothetical protein